jgi:hypothetical protein
MLDQVPNLVHRIQSAREVLLQGCQQGVRQQPASRLVLRIPPVDEPQFLDGLVPFALSQQQLAVLSQRLQIVRVFSQRLLDALPQRLALVKR